MENLKPEQLNIPTENTLPDTKLTETEKAFRENADLAAEFERARVFFPHDQSQFVINPENDMLMSDGHEYSDYPRMRSLIIRANAIRAKLPPVANDMTRLWRGNRPDELGKNPIYTNSLEGIAMPFLDAYGGKLSYVDVPTNNLKEYVNLGGAPDSEFTIPPQFLARAQQIDEDITEEMRAQAFELYKTYLHEGGAPDANAARIWLGKRG